MKSVTILLDTIEKVRKFVSQVSMYEGEFDIISDRYIIDAKSIMGIFSLDLNKPLKLTIYSENAALKAIEELKEFIVE